MLIPPTVREIDWRDAARAIPAFLTLITIPLSNNISGGVAFGFISCTVLKLPRGDYRRISWLGCLLTALVVLRFVYLGSEGQLNLGSERR